MRTFEIEVQGHSLPDIINGLDEAKKRIEAGNSEGFDENEDGRFGFTCHGQYDEDREKECWFDEGNSTNYGGKPL